MNLPELITSLAVLAVTIIVGIIGFFLKRTISAVDSCVSEIKDIKKDYATKEELDTFRGDIKDEIRKISSNIDDIKDNYIKKDDFVRSMSDTNTRLERIYNFLLDMNGGHRNG